MMVVDSLINKLDARCDAKQSSEIEFPEYIFYIPKIQFPIHIKSNKMDFRNLEFTEYKKIQITYRNFNFRNTTFLFQKLNFRENAISRFHVLKHDIKNG